jgi:DNA polymerase I-like protein with 3'-5' exonuclease and polymerase domains
MPIGGADYSQLELRVGTGVWPDDAFIADLLSGDFHGRTVDKLVGMGLLQNDGPIVRRTKAKNATFGTFFLSKGHDIAAEVGATVEEMVEIVEAWTRAYPQFKAAQDELVSRIQREEIIHTITGMPHQGKMTGKRWIDNETVRTIANAVVQGPAAQITRRAQTGVRNWFKRDLWPKGYRTQLYNNVHDAVYWHGPEKEQVVVCAGVCHIMENVPMKETWGFELPVPLKVDLKVAESWGWLDVEKDKVQEYMERYQLPAPKEYML